MQNKAIQLNPSVIYNHKENTIICVSEMDEDIIELSGGAFYIWDLISKGEVTIDSIHESMSKEYDTYGPDEQADTEEFIDNLFKLKIVEHK